MLVRKFCACGKKLEREVADEMSAYQTVMRFWLEHSGRGHGPVSGGQYLKIIQRIIQSKARKRQRKRANSYGPLLSLTEVE
ncbi:MAG TPA: hypothetical protein VJ464_15960 [Blastocatellia bacterium]|nr:hypothetical protein [Blastocatellia bacterium]